MSVAPARAAEVVLAPLERAAGLLPSVNLLPPEIAEQRQFRRLQLCLGAGLLATVGVVVLLQVQAVAGTAQAERDLQDVTARSGALRTEVSQYGEVQAVYGRAAAARAVLAEAMGDEVRFSGLLDALSVNLPDDVWLQGITFTQAEQTDQAAGTAPTAPGIGQVSFAGVAMSHDDVASWLESLDRQPGYADAYLTTATTGLTGDRATVTFTSTVRLTAEALSGRHTTHEGS